VALGEIPSLPSGPHMSCTHGISPSFSQISTTRWREEAGRLPTAGVASAAAAAASPARRWSHGQGRGETEGFSRDRWSSPAASHAEIRLGARHHLAELELTVVLGPLWSAADLGPPAVGGGAHTRVAELTPVSYGHPWAHYSGGYQDRLLGGPLGLIDFCCMTPAGVKHNDYKGIVLS
jgi:hypothetical protein